MGATFVDAGEAVSRQCLRGEASRSYPPTPSLLGQALFPRPYVEPLRDARTKPVAFFNILLVSWNTNRRLLRLFRDMDQRLIGQQDVSVPFEQDRIVHRFHG